jgi:hypothetical protein
MAKLAQRAKKGFMQKTSNTTGIVPDPIVLLELILPTDTQLYRWQKSGMVEVIEAGTLFSNNRATDN